MSAGEDIANVMDNNKMTSGSGAPMGANLNVIDSSDYENDEDGQYEEVDYEDYDNEEEAVKPQQQQQMPDGSQGSAGRAALLMGTPLDQLKEKVQETDQEDEEDYEADGDFQQQNADPKADDDLDAEDDLDGEDYAEDNFEADVQA